MKSAEFKYQQLKIDSRWKIVKNEFIDLEPDNDYPIDEVFFYFDEDILQATFDDYLVDLGFYGGYLQNERCGFFKIVVLKGNFLEGELLESFISRSTEIIREKLNFYFEGIPNGLLSNIKGIKIENGNGFKARHIYSAVEKISYRLTSNQLKELSKAKNENST